MTPIFNINYPEILNALLKQQNTNLISVKDLPIDDGASVNLLVLAVQHGEEDGTNDAIVGSKEVYKNISGEKSLVSTSVILGSTTHAYGVEVFSDGSVFFNTKEYLTIEQAQNDENLKVGEVYKIDGQFRYKK